MTPAKSWSIRERRHAWHRWLAALALLLPLAIAPSATATGQGARSDAMVSEEFIYAEAPFPQAHASTLVETTGGEIVAAWFGGTHERHPDVEIHVARLGHGGWSTPVAVADGLQEDGSRLPTWNPVLFQAPGGPLWLFYKVGPDPRRWWGMAMRSLDGGQSWSAAERLPAGVLGPIKNKPVVLANGDWLSPSSTETGTARDAEWRLHFERSADGGRTWTRTAAVEPLNGLDAIQPSLLFHADGRLQAIARTAQGVVASTWSSDGGHHWTPVDAIDLANPNSGTDALTLADGRQLIVYNPGAHHPDTPGKGPRWPLAVALSDDGVRWRRVLTLESGPIEHGYAYPAVIQTRDGLVHVSYTWGRVRIKHVVLDPTRLEPEA